MSREARLREIVAKAVAAKPLPASVDDLDRVSRRKVEQQAAALGVTPAAHYEAIKRERAEAAERAAQVHAAVKYARQYGRR